MDIITILSAIILIGILASIGIIKIIRDLTIESEKNGKKRI